MGDVWSLWGMGTNAKGAPTGDLRGRNRRHRPSPATGRTGGRWRGPVDLAVLARDVREYNLGGPEASFADQPWPRYGNAHATRRS